MTTVGVDGTQRTAAKLAGLAWLFTTAIIVFAFYGISVRLTIPGDAAGTARNIVAHEMLYRVSVASSLVYSAGIVALLTALYVILAKANRALALLAAILRLVYALMFVAIALNQFNALRLLSGADYLREFEAEQLQALMRLSLVAGFDAYYVGLLFWGLASTICGYLWYRSRYIPRALAVWGVVSSAWAAVCALVFFVLPGFGSAVNLYSFDVPLASFEMATSSWLLFKGLPPSGPAATDHVQVGAA